MLMSRYITLYQFSVSLGQHTLGSLTVVLSVVNSLVCCIWVSIYNCDMDLYSYSWVRGRKGVIDNTCGFCTPLKIHNPVKSQSAKFWSISEWVRRFEPSLIHCGCFSADGLPVWELCTRYKATTLTLYLRLILDHWFKVKIFLYNRKIRMGPPMYLFNPNQLDSSY